MALACELQLMARYSSKGRENILYNHVYILLTWSHIVFHITAMDQYYFCQYNVELQCGTLFTLLPSNEKKTYFASSSRLNEMSEWYCGR